MIENDVVFHYKHLREVKKGGEVTIIEKGIDTWYALETYELTLLRKFEVVVLITGDADHEMTQTRADGRNFLIRVTDPELLQSTGGIVQGMSGSPIIQDGKLVGAVTHVLVNSPDTGYGIFIENMLEAAEQK